VTRRRIDEIALLGGGEAAGGMVTGGNLSVERWFPARPIMTELNRLGGGTPSSPGV
jgi:hypothetical protein